MNLKETLMNKFYDDKFVFLKRGGACLSLCKVKNDGTRIGSVYCKTCENMVSLDTSPKGYDFIICSKIDEALGEFSPPVVAKNNKKQ